MRLLPLALTLAVLLGAPQAHAQGEDEVRDRIEELHGDAAGFDEAFELLTQAMRFGDPVTVAELGDYPLEVAANGEVYDILDAQDMVQYYDRLVMPETQTLVAEQTYGDLFVNADGVMFGDGELWMSRVCHDDSCTETSWAIIAINN